MINLNLAHIRQSIDFKSYQERLTRIHDLIETKQGPGGDFLGWNRWPELYDKNEFAEIVKTAGYIRKNFEVLVVCGIGGSYLGSRAVIEALRGLYPKPGLEIIYFGQTFSPTYTAQVLEYLKNKKFAVNVISKSGTTTETSIAFRLLKELLEKKLPKADVVKAIYATTDKEKGALRALSLSEGYKMFTLPDDIGGRYSVLTAVGLLPIACAGLNVQALLEGAHDAMKAYAERNVEKNLAAQYAIARYTLGKAKAVEMLITYEPQMAMFAEWWKQLFGESEGKEHKGLLPGSVNFTTDLHSLGQFIQDGTPTLFETVLYVKKPMLDVVVPQASNDADGLNYLANKPLSFVNEKAYLGTLEAHTGEGHVPVIAMTAAELNEKVLGHLLYFFMKSCAISGYLLGINPFNQPGVEVYKRNMFRLLGKKGY